MTTIQKRVARLPENHLNAWPTLYLPTYTAQREITPDIHPVESGPSSNASI